MKQHVKGALLAGLIMLTAGNFFGQEFINGVRFGGVGEDVVKSATTDLLGNTYVTGYFTDSADYDPGDGVYQLKANGFYDVFVLKLDPDGNFVWARSFGGPFSDYATSIAVNETGEVYLTCVFEESADFDPGSGVFELTSNGILDIAVVKLDADGNFLWASAFGSESYEEATAIAVDAAGDIYVAGYFDTPISIGGAGVILESQGGQDLFVLKMNADGALLWAKTVGGADQDLALNLVVDEAAGVFVTGSFSDEVDFDPGEGEAMRTAQGSMDGYILNLSAEGEFVYAATFGGSGGDLSYSVAVDEDGNAVAGGSFMENFLAGDEVFSSVEWEDAFAVKVDPAGDVVWAAQLGGTQYQNVYDVSIDAAGHIFLAGYFSGIADMDPSEAPLLFEPQSNQPFDAFLTVLDAGGNWMYSGQFGGSDFLEHHSVCIDGQGNIYLAGAFQGQVDLDPSADAEEMADNAGFRDSYLVRLSPAGTTGIDQFYSQAGPLVVYPNPAKDQIKMRPVANPANTDETFTYSIHDDLGRLILQGETLPGTEIDVTALAPGFYTLRYATANRIWAGKWLKQ